MYFLRSKNQQEVKESHDFFVNKNNGAENQMTNRENTLKFGENFIEKNDGTFKVCINTGNGEMINKANRIEFA